MNLDEKYLKPRKKNKKLRRFIKILIIVLIGLLVVFRIISSIKNKKISKNPNEKIILPVKADKVVEDMVSDIVYSTGDVEGIKKSNIYSDYVGKIVKILVKTGDYVNSGQTLAYINRDVVAGTFSNYPIKTLINGIVTKVFLEEGDTATSVQPIFRVENFESVLVKVGLAEDAIKKVKKGQEAEVYSDAYPNTRYKGVVYEITPMLDPVSRLQEVKILVSNSNYADKLLPGMYVRVWINVATIEKALLVPYSAVLKDDKENFYVFKFDNGIARKIIVKLGYTKYYGDDTEKAKIQIITKEIKPGDFVVYMGHQFLTDGDLIKFVYDDKEYGPQENNGNVK